MSRLFAHGNPRNGELSGNGVSMTASDVGSFMRGIQSARGRFSTTACGGQRAARAVHLRTGATSIGSVHSNRESGGMVVYDQTGRLAGNGRRSEYDEDDFAENW